MCNNSVIATKSGQKSGLFLSIQKSPVRRDRESGLLLNIPNLFVGALQDPVVAGKLKAAAGLAFLQAKKYKQAAKRFTEVGSGCVLFTPMIDPCTSNST